MFSFHPTILLGTVRETALMEDSFFFFLSLKSTKFIIKEFSIIVRFKPFHVYPKLISYKVSNCFQKCSIIKLFKMTNTQVVILKIIIY